MVKFCEIFLLCVTVTAVACASVPNWNNVKTLTEFIINLQRNPNVRKGISSLQRNLKQAATMGIMLGTVKVEHQMELNINKLLNEFIKTLQKSNMKQTKKKLIEIETTMTRDGHAIEILRTAMELAMKTKTVREYRQALNKIASDDGKPKNQKPPQKLLVLKTDDKTMMLNEMQTKIQNHLKLMRDKVGSTVQMTMKSIDSKKKSEVVSTPPTITSYDAQWNEIFNHDIVRWSQFQVPIWPAYPVDVKSYYRFRRQNENDITDDQKENQVETSKESEKEEDFDDAFAPPPASNGGITALIASLSGGEGGSDVGALIGAISGVVTNLFGPGGLDVPSLISSGTSLLAGLLGGDENFGKVLGSYIGLGIEGLSGGGGADNNGAFFGNFIGTLFASLSADPEEEQGPQPKLFFDSFFKGFEQSKQKRGTEDSTSNSKGYFFEFISNIISSLVGGITNLILNASLGSSGGSSQGSADLSAGSSQGSHTGSAYASQTSSMGSMHPQPHAKPKK